MDLYAVTSRALKNSIVKPLAVTIILVAGFGANYLRADWPMCEDNDNYGWSKCNDACSESGCPADSCQFVPYYTYGDNCGASISCTCDCGELGDVPQGVCVNFLEN